MIKLIEIVQKKWHFVVIDFKYKYISLCIIYYPSSYHVYNLLMIQYLNKSNTLIVFTLASIITFILLLKSMDVFV